ncbi:MAG: hypothetical protein R6X12_09110 [bacterium]
MARPVRDPEQERGERILREMARLERRLPETRYWRWLPWLLTALVLFAILFVLMSNTETFRLAWTRLARPDSLPGR